VEVEGPGREVRPAADREELAGGGGGAVDGPPDLRQVLPRLGRERALVLNQRDVAQDAGEQVVEVVRDAAGEVCAEPAAPRRGARAGGSRPRRSVTSVVQPL